MAKILVIPDVHLKLNMFDSASILMEALNIEIAVFLGDLVDEWNQENNYDLYKATIDRAIAFKNQYPKSLFCWGNHEVGYLTTYWNCPGNSRFYKNDIRLLLNNYERHVEPKYVHYIDDCLFSHAGIDTYLVANLENATDYNVTIEDVAEMFNHRPFDYMGNYNSPLWLRPEKTTNYYSKFIQFVGHTPVKHPTCLKNIWLVDTFSKTPNGLQYGHNEFVVYGTKSRNMAFYTVQDNKIKRTNFLRFEDWDEYII